MIKKRNNKNVDNKYSDIFRTRQAEIFQFRLNIFIYSSTSFNKICVDRTSHNMSLMKSFDGVKL